MGRASRRSKSPSKSGFHRRAKRNASLHETEEKRPAFHNAPVSPDIRCGRCGVQARMKHGAWHCPKCGSGLSEGYG